MPAIREAHGRPIRAIPTHTLPNTHTPPALISRAAHSDMTFPEFLRLLLSGEVEAHTKDWKAGTQQMRMFKFAFEMADMDGNGDVERAELQQAINSLHAGPRIGDDYKGDDFDQLWTFLAGKRKMLSCDQFIDGMVRIRDDDVFNKILQLTEMNPLTGVVFDVPVPPWESRMLETGLGTFERFGMRVLRSMDDEEMDPHWRAALLRKAKDGTLHLLQGEQQDALRTLHTRCVVGGQFVRSRGSPPCTRNLYLRACKTQLPYWPHFLCNLQKRTKSGSCSPE